MKTSEIPDPGKIVIISSMKTALFPDNYVDQVKDQLKKVVKEAVIHTSADDCMSLYVLDDKDNKFYFSIHKGFCELKKTIYISGAISGIPNKNVDKFEKYENKFIQLGYNVVNPQKIKEHELHGDVHEEWMNVDLKHMLPCDEIAVIPGFQNSKGTKQELFVAKSTGKKIIDAESLEEMQFDFNLTYTYKFGKAKETSEC